MRGKLYVTLDNCGARKMTSELYVGDNLPNYALLDTSPQQVWYVSGIDLSGMPKYRV